MEPLRNETSRLQWSILVSWILILVLSWAAAAGLFWLAWKHLEVLAMVVLTATVVVIVREIWKGY